MNEINKNTLHAALVRLSDYTPPAGIWESLEANLDADADLAAAARQLPAYDPPAAVWEHLATRLPARPTARRAILWLRYAAAVALAAALCGMWWMLRPAMGNAEQIVVTQETMDQQIVATVRESEDDAFQWVQDLCAARAPVCEEPAFKSLKSELDELTTAKVNLHTALGQYGDDPDLTAQLVRIELARSQLLQEIMQLI